MTDGIVGAPVGKPEVGPIWRVFFWAAALFNWLVGLAGMLAPVPTIDSRIIGLLFFSFGVIYALVARDPQRFGPTLWAGVIGNLGIVGLLSPFALGAGGSALALGILAITAIFAIGFLAFLLTR